ncbi:MAG: hypothetical protein JWO73_376 [Candidatus Taylorbacteria bacterium]|nr:hypothetical protein [Candidatus Taylorbacteria bacterium]
MKISLHKATFGILTAVLALTVIAIPAKAEGTTTDVQVSASASIDAGASTSTHPIVPAKQPLRSKINDRMEKIKENAAQNRDQRNKVLEERKDIKKTRIDQVKDIRTDAKAEMKAEKGDKAARKETMNKMRNEVFTARRDAIVKQLNLSIENLQNIKARIDTRIAKLKADGKDTSAAEKILATATEKIAAAKTNIDALAAIVPPANATASSSASAETDLTKPRALAETAMKSVREARDVLKNAVESIAHSMGREIDHKTATGTAVTASTTVSASSTNQ